MTNGSSIKALRVTEAAIHGSDSSYTVESLPLGRGASDTVDLFSYSAGSRIERFADDTNFTSSGVYFEAIRPTKYASNPVSPVEADPNGTWDYDKYYVNVLHDGSGYKAWIGVYDSSADPGVTYETSADGITWTQPNLGIVTYGGNTNNNLITDQYDPTVVDDGSRYLVLIGADAASASNNQALIYSSTDGITGLTLEKTITHGVYSEFHGFVKRPDGRYIVYYTFGHTTEQRAIGAYLSDSTDITGTWTDQGTVLNLVLSAESQYYYLNPTVIDGVFYGVVGRFNQSTDLIWQELWTSPDGLSWELQAHDWVPNGDDYDPGMVIGKTLAVNGYDVRFYYGGSVGDHAASLPRDSRLCYASLHLTRLIRVNGPGGTLTTTSVTPTAPLKISAASSGGNLKVELLDPSDDSVLTGYAKADCDNLDGNHAAKIVTWNGLGIPTGIPVKIKFYLDA